MLQTTIIYFIFGALLLVKGTRSAPNPERIPSHCEVVNSTSIEQFHSTLLNKDILEFLEPCCDINCCNLKNILCPVYFEIVSNLSSTYAANKHEKAPVTPELLNNVIEFHSENSTQFCMEFPKLLSTNLTFSADMEPFKPAFADTEHCIMLCNFPSIRDDKVVTAIKPLCKVIFWLLTYSPASVITEQQNEKSANKTVVQPNLAENNQNIKSSLATTIPVNDNNNLPGKKILMEELKNPTQKVVAVEDNQRRQSEEKINNVNKVEAPNKPATLKEGIFQQEKNQPKVANELPLKREPLSGNIVEASTKSSTAAGKNDVSSSVPMKENIPESKPKEDIVIQTENMAELINQGNEENGIDGMDQEDLVPKEDMDLEEDNDALAQPDTKLVDDEPKINDDINTVLDNSVILGNNERKHDAVIVAPDPFHQEEGSNFFTYFLIGMFSCIIMYIIYHNKSKILALLLEGRRSQKGRNGRRKHTAQYRKLDTNLEEAITSTASGRGSQIIY